MNDLPVRLMIVSTKGLDKEAAQIALAEVFNQLVFHLRNGEAVVIRVIGDTKIQTYWVERKGVLLFADRISKEKVH